MIEPEGIIVLGECLIVGFYSRERAEKYKKLPKEYARDWELGKEVRHNASFRDLEVNKYEFYKTATKK